MKKTLFFAGLLVMLGACLIVVFGCSSDSTSSGSGNNNYDDPNYEMMDEFMNGDAQDISNTALKLSLDLVDTVANMGGVSKPRFLALKPGTEIPAFDSLNYTFSNYWHIFELTASLIITENGRTDTLYFSGIDSIRFRNSGSNIILPDSADEMNIRCHYDVDISSSEGGEVEISAIAEYDITGESFESTQFTLDGAVVEEMTCEIEDSSNVTCTLEMEIDQTIDNLVIDEDLECPLSGTIEMTASVDLDCQGENVSLEISETWNMNITFNNGTITIEMDANNGEDTFTFTEACGD